LKRLAIILAVVIAVVAVAVAAAPFLIPGSFLKLRVAERLSALTGRAVTVSGTASLSIYPSLAITVGDLAIANPAGMGEDPTLTTPRLDTRLRLWPLLLGRIEFDEFVLTNPTIHLIVDPDGRANWIYDGGAIMPALPGGEGQISDVGLGHLLVNNATVLYDNLKSNTREEMHEVDLDIDWPTVSATVSGRGRLVWRDEPVEFTGLLATPMALFGGRASAARFAIASTPLRVSFSGRATNSGGLHLDGDGSVSTPSMRRTIEWLGTPMGTGPILGAASINGTTAITATNVDFTQASLELDGNSAVGALGVSFGGVRPRIAGKLNAQQLDLSAYVEAVRANVFGSGMWVIAPARLPFAEAIDADLAFSTAHMTVGATEIGDTWSTVKIADGVLDAVLQGANLYGGQIGLHLTTTPGSTLQAQLHIDAKDVPVGPTLSGLAGITALEGNLTGSADLTASGRGWGEVANTLAGKGRVTIADGKLTGIDLPLIAYELADPLAQPITANGGTTSFNATTASFEVNGADLKTDDLFMEGTDFHLSLSGHGSVASGVVEARAVVTNATETIPIAVSGTWQAPEIGRVWVRNAPAAQEREH
jgi:AsmA protein